MHASMMLVSAFALSCLPRLAAAQETTPTPSASPSASPTPTLSPEDQKLLDEIEAATSKVKPSGSSTQTTAQSAPGIGGGPANLLNPAIAFDGLFAAAAYSGPQGPSSAHDPIGTGLTLQNLELTLSANVDPYMRADGHIIFTLEGVEVEEAYLTTLALPYSLQIKAGQFFTPFGRHNRIHPHAWQFADQNLVNVLIFGGDGLRNPSVSMSWLAPLPVYTEVLAAVIDARGPTATSFLGEVAPPATERVVDSPADMLYLGKASISFPIGESLTVLAGASGLTGPNPTSATARTVIAGGDLYVKWRPPSSLHRFAWFQAEAIAREYDVGDQTQRDEGFYAFAGARVSQRYEVGVRAESIRSDRVLDPLALPWRNRFSSAITFRPSEFSKIRVQGNYDVQAGAEDPVLGAILQWEFLIGAHGAHAF